jgi:hypothetical protein
MEILEQLKAPFPPDAISWRVGATSGDKTKGIALAYIDARDVMRRFDDVCGLDWQCRYSHVTDKGVVCEIGVKVGGEWVWRANGAGETDVEAEKGAMSDAFKRAAVLWGVGRYLYDLDSPWVALEAKGRSYIISPSEVPKLRSLLGRSVEPRPDDVKARAQAQNAAVDALRAAIASDDPWPVWRLRIKEEAAYSAACRTLNTKEKAATRELESRGARMAGDYPIQLADLAKDSDEHGAAQLWDELTKLGKELVWADLDKPTRDFIKQLKREAA